ncbi:MAG: AmmeMemoRadiSam system protein B, partial [Clostridiaceae bacterium]|nr:AmmeMemoRadiSam system protein B [Clostridiaceae bacterium]
MGNIAGAFIFPHPPIMVEEVGGSETKKVSDSVAGALKASERIAAIKPDVIVLITPHGAMLEDAMTIAADERVEGSLARFGAPETKLSFDNDLELADKIMDMADKKQAYCIPIHEDVKKTYRVQPGMDHGAMVPLYFVTKKYRQFKLVHITYSLLSREQHYKLGIAIRDAVTELDRKAVIIASGDLSHRLTRNAPAGYNPRGS